MIKITSPLKGEFIKLENLGDPAFSQGMLGEGAGVLPSEGKVYSPFDGVVNTIFPTKHAIALTSDDGVKMIIHIGIDTVNMKGKGFKSKLDNGDKVKAGQLLMEFDIKKIQKAGYSIETPVIVTNMKDFAGLKISEKAELDTSDIIFEIEPK